MAVLQSIERAFDESRRHVGMPVPICLALTLDIGPSVKHSDKVSGSKILGQLEPCIPINTVRERGCKKTDKHTEQTRKSHGGVTCRHGVYFLRRESISPRYLSPLAIRAAS